VQRADETVVEYADAGSNGAEAELGIAGCTDLSRHDHVEWRAERVGHGPADDDAAARDG
jgi:hypothetical protein